jgi:release factor glutamine methyltransferase
MDTWTIETLIQTAARYLQEKGSASPRLDAELLLAESLGLDRVQLYMQFDRPLDVSTIDHYRSLIARRAAHEPVAYILGQANFRHLRLGVNASVLIPRPETEELVEVALDLLKRRPPWGALSVRAGERDPEEGEEELPRTLIADVGTGSGAIALSLAQEAGVRVLATDTSRDALEVAAANAAAAGLERLVEFRQADLLSGVPDRGLHLIVSNPPYVTSGDLSTLAEDIRLYEPLSALEAGSDGLDVFQRLLPEAARALRPGGTILLEVGHDQAGAVTALADEEGFTAVTVHRDLSGKERIVEATLPGVWAVPLVPPPGRSLNESEVHALRQALSAGAIIGVPTDTVYGIAARWDCNSGVRRLFSVKGRASERPIQVLFPSAGAIARALPDLDPAAGRVLESLLPGPFTLIVATGVARPEMVGTADSLGVRVPDHAALLALLALLDVPLAATSANLSGDADVRRFAAVGPALLANCSVAFDDPAFHARGMLVAGMSPAERPQPSTVVDLRPLSRGETPVVVREGAIPGAEVLQRIADLG